MFTIYHCKRLEQDVVSCHENLRGITIVMAYQSGGHGVDHDAIFDALQARYPIPVDGFLPTPTTSPSQRLLNNFEQISPQTNQLHRNRSSSTHSRGSDRSRDGARDQDSGSPGPNQTAPQARISTRPGSELFLPTSPMVPSYRHLYPHVQDSPTEIMIRDMSGIHFAIPKESFGQPVKGARPGSLPRAATAPAALPAKARGKSTTSNGGSSRGAGVRLTSSKKQGVRPTRIDKDATTARRISRRQTEIPTTSKSFVPHSPEDSPVEAPRDSRQNYMLPMPWRRRRKGETMSMLVDAGFFPVQELIYAPGDDLQERTHIRLDLSDLTKALPPTPSSITGTPTEYYGLSVSSPRQLIRNRRLGSTRRAPLFQVSEGDGAVNASSTLSAMDSAIARLSAIPEDGAQQENEPLAEPVATEVPVATEIHLATGTVVTVRPPELTAWQRSIYLEGPIKLPKPALLPRKGSIASLEPFQEAVDRVYQDALIMPRRKGDNAVVDDICEWFDEFGLGCGSFDHDRFDTFEDEDAGAALMARLEILSEEESKRLSLPPAEQGAEARDEVAAQTVDRVTPTIGGVMDITAHATTPPAEGMIPILIQKPSPPAVEEGASASLTTVPEPASPALHAREPESKDITRPVSQAVQTPFRSSVDVLPLLSPPADKDDSRERSPSLVESISSSLGRGSKSSFEWDVEETSARPSWLLTGVNTSKRRPTVAPVQQKKRTSRAPNPVTRMRRLVQTASALV